MKLGTRARWLSIFVAVGFGLLARSMAAQSDGASQTRTRAQTTTAPAKKGGGWHHFGDQERTSRTRPAVRGGWHYFGAARHVPAPKPHPRAARLPPRRHYHPVTTREMEREMLRLINRDRRNSGGGRSRPLRWDAKLATEARAHSLDMVREGYFGHVAPDGQTVIDRLDAAKIAWTAEGENIAIDPSVTGAERAFMNEPRYQRNHRWNILNPRYTDVGVGIVRGPGGEYYITQDFIERKTAR